MLVIAIVFLCLIVLCILWIFYMNRETHWLTVTHHTFHRKKISHKGEPITFLHLTDLHLGRTNIPEKTLLEAIENNPSDFLVFTGDYFEREEQIPKLLHLIDGIRTFYEKPIYLCYGNHDRSDVFSLKETLEAEVTQKLQQRNVIVLENQAITYTKQSNDAQSGSIQTTSLRIIGLSDARSNEAEIMPLIEQYYPTTDRDAMPALLMTHNSDILMKMSPASVDFAVAGHTHGAQVRSPWNLEVKLLHRKDILSSRKNIIRGFHRYNETDLYITRGLGCSLLPIRFLSRPELLVVMISD